MLHKASKTVLIYLLLFILSSKNVLFYNILCADIEYEDSDDDYDNFENITETYDDLGDYNNEYATNDRRTNKNSEIDNKDDNAFMPTLSPQQESDLKIFSENLEQQLLLDQKANFPNYKNITFPPNEYEVEKLFAIITQINNTNNGSGSFYSSFDTGNYGGVQTGELKEKMLQVIKGHYTEKFKMDLPGGLPPIDVIRNVGYIADEKGYQPYIINYTIDDHRSDTEPHYDVPFDDIRRISKEYNAHYKPQEQFSNIQLPNITNKPLVKDDSGNYNFGFNTLTYGRAESSETINKNTENETRIVKGQYTNIVGNGPFFVRQTIGYIADENGFQPSLIDSHSNNGWRLVKRFMFDHYNSERLAEDVAIHFKPLEVYKDVKLPTLDNQDDQNKNSDGYQFSFSSDSYNRSEISETKNKGTENETLVIKGQYTEKIKNELGEAVIRQIGYVADERGYQPFIIKSYVEYGISTTPASVQPPVMRPLPPGSPRGQGIGSSFIGNALGHLG